MLVIFFSVRAGYLEFDRELVRAILKFGIIGVLLGAALWLTAWLAPPYLALLPALRSEAALALLILVGAVIYGAAILILFGPRWIKRLLRG